MKILIVDDQRSARHVLTELLSPVEGARVTGVESLERARAAMRADAFDLAFVDMRLSDDPSDRDGLVVLRELREQAATAVVMVTALGDMPAIRAAIRAGAHDYVLKDDLCEEVVLKIVDEVRLRSKLEREVLEARARAGASAFQGLVGASAAMQRLRATIERAAVSDRPALVLGPSGAGKELVVRALHALGPHPSAPLLDVNCGALPAPLVESQLFGHEKGSFTGAAKSPGYLEAVGEGTLFLDELGELPLELQAKLLRVLETGGFRALGSLSERRFRGRVVAATHADLGARVREGRFREDLFHRLDVLRVRVPSLEERREDIAALVTHFAARQRRPLRFSEDALRALESAPWPGNVRQLRNLVDRLAIFCDDDPVTTASLEVLEGLSAPSAGGALREAARLVLASDSADKLGAIEGVLVEEAMRLSGDNKSQAARLLGVHRKVVERRLGRGAGEEEGG
jgi:DNA-binding NtrC family response regulator